jgi:hypothetical protein
MIEQFKPVRTELINIRISGLILRQNSTDQAGYADEHQQADGKAHRTEQFQEIGRKATYGGYFFHKG